MKLITETSYDFELVEDKANNVYVAGIFSSADVVNANNRKYKKPILEREVDKINEKLEKKSLWGELGHPNMPEVNADRIAILTTQLEWKNNNLFGKAKVLDTPMGNIAKTLIETILIKVPNQVVIEEEMITVNIEKEPVVDITKHKKNIDRLMELKEIHPQTGDDIFVPEE